MRRDAERLDDVLAHRYSDMTHAILATTVEGDLPTLVEAVQRLRRSID